MTHKLWHAAVRTMETPRYETSLRNSRNSWLFRFTEDHSAFINKFLSNWELNKRYKGEYNVIHKPSWIIILVPVESTDPSQQCGESSVSQLRFQVPCLKPHSHQVAAGDAVTSLCSSVAWAANPAPPGGFGSLSAAQRSPREGQHGAEFQPPAMRPGTGSLGKGRHIFAIF